MIDLELFQLWKDLKAIDRTVLAIAALFDGEDCQIIYITHRGVVGNHRMTYRIRRYDGGYLFNGQYFKPNQLIEVVTVCLDKMLGEGAVLWRLEYGKGEFES